MSKKIGAVNLDKALKEILKEYGDDVYNALDEAVDDVCLDGVEKLRSVRSFAPNGHPSGDYSGSWVYDNELKSLRYKTRRVIHNEEHYRLTHLLEHGHVIRNGTGRTFGTTPAYVHIEPVEKWTINELPKVVKDRIEKI